MAKKFDEYKYLKIIGIVCAVVVAAVSVGLLAYSSYYWAHNNKSTVTTTYVDQLTYDANKSYFAELNYYSNEKKNGQEVYEVRLNYYTDTTIPKTSEEYKNVYSTGIQFIGSPRFGSKDVNVGSYQAFLMFTGSYYARKTTISGEYYYYNTTNGTSYEAVKKFSIQSKWIVDCDGNLAQLEQIGIPTKKEKEKTVYDNSYKVYQDTARKTYSFFDINSFIKAIFTSVKSLSNGISVLQFDLSEHFTSRQYNSETGNFDETADGDLNYMFMNVKINKSSNGLVSDSQSLFGKLRGKDRTQEGKDYYAANTIYTLTESDFAFTPYNGSSTNYLGSLKQSAVNFLKEFGNLDIVININLSSAWLTDQSFIFYGLALDPFKSLTIKNIAIRSDTPKTFYIPYSIPNLTTSNVNLAIWGV